jgi:hypothetical protein
MNWEQAIAEVSARVVHVECPNSSRTGFLAFYNADGSWCAIATAAHVVSYADNWQQPIRIKNELGSITLQPDSRVVYIDQLRDSAVVFFFKHNLQIPQEPIKLRPLNSPCNTGTPLGWLGYPAIAPNTLCFFSGRVSATHPSNRAYFVDGVAIHGVSGGPVFHVEGKGKDGHAEIIGAISSYIPNLSTGQSLPGLLLSTDVSQFHAAAQSVKNMDDALAAKAQLEATAGTAPTAISSGPIGGGPIGGG